MPSAMLSEHFSLAEFTISETAARLGLDNEPDAKAFKNLQQLADVMEQVRSLCGDNPVTILSGYRAPEVNAAVGGSSTSAHMVGLAADFIVPEFGDPLTICLTLEPMLNDLGVDQLIWEFGDWVHLGLSEGDPRCQCLTINNNGTTVGFPDL
jgi:zinc D-Ala-D-Ala carboxypeptidase